MAKITKIVAIFITASILILTSVFFIFTAKNGENNKIYLTTKPYHKQKTALPPQGNGTIEICKLMSTDKSDGKDLYSYDGGISWKNYGPSSRVSFSVRLELLKNGVPEKINWEGMPIEQPWPIDHSKIAKKIFLINSIKNINKATLSLQLVKSGHPKGKLKILINNHELLLDVDQVEGEKCSEAKWYEVEIDPDVLKKDENEVILSGDKEWFYSEKGNLHSFPLGDSNAFENEEVFKEKNIQSSTFSDDALEFEIGLWPQNYQSALNLSFDDINCENFVSYDGSEKNQLSLLTNLLSTYPNLKVTLFFTPNPYNLYEENEENEFLVTKDDCKKEIKKFLSNFKNIEISDHGWNHYSGDNYFPHIEFEFDDKQTIKEKLQKAIDAFNNADINITGIRSPGWGMGINFELIDAIKELNLKYLAGSSTNDGLNYYTKKVSNFYPTYYDDILTIPQNSSLITSKELVDKITKMNGLIGLKGHFYRESDNVNRAINGLTGENLDRIKTVLNYLKDKYPERIWYTNMDEIANFWLAKMNLKAYYKVSNKNQYRLVLENNSSYQLEGLNLLLRSEDLFFENHGIFSKETVIAIPKNSSKELKIIKKTD